MAKFIVVLSVFVALAVADDGFLASKIASGLDGSVKLHTPTESKVEAKETVELASTERQLRDVLNPQKELVQPAAGIAQVEETLPEANNPYKNLRPGVYYEVLPSRDIQFSEGEVAQRVSKAQSPLVPTFAPQFEHETHAFATTGRKLVPVSYYQDEQLLRGHDQVPSFQERPLHPETVLEEEIASEVKNLRPGLYYERSSPNFWRALERQTAEWQRLHKTDSALPIASQYSEDELLARARIQNERLVPAAYYQAEEPMLYSRSYPKYLYPRY